VHQTTIPIRQPISVKLLQKSVISMRAFTLQLRVHHILWRLHLKISKSGV